MENIKKYNLIYNLCLTHINPILYFNLSNLKKYINKFNGKKIININFLDKSFAETFISQYFKEYNDINFYYTNNYETNGWHELKPFIEKLMPSVYSLDENEYTFYGHTKGVTRYNHHTEFVCLLWAHTMYSKNLDNFKYISEILNKHACCGTFKLNRPFTALSFVPWHYSGAFFWFNNKSIFSKNWQKFYPSIYGLEGYLATHFNTEEAFSIPPELPFGYEDIYNKNNWEKFYTL
jgi:hypothetical protein